MEAMAMKLPVVASAVDGTRDLIEDGVSGYLVPSGNVDAFAERIGNSWKIQIAGVDLGKRLIATYWSTLGWPE